MLIEIEKDIFEGNDFKGLNYLIQVLSYKQRYGVFIDYGSIKDTALYLKLDIDDQKELEESYNQAITASLDPEYFVTNIQNTEAKKFNMEESIRFFAQPVSIILENSLNDSPFVEAIVKNFDRLGNIQKHMDNGWIQFENAGGCNNIPNFIKGKLQSFNNLPKNNRLYLRAFVIMDSDKQHANASIKQDKQTVMGFLEDRSNKIPYHILEKREMENYMPVEVFEQIATDENKVFIEAYLRLSDEQKDYFDLEKGFNKNRSDRNYDVQVKELYRSVSDSDWLVLKNGQHNNPYGNSFKSEFPKLFLHESVTQENLKKRCGTNELTNILDKINGLL